MPSVVELYLIRHGVAANPGEGWPDDTKRPLTHKGTIRVRSAAAALNALGVSLDQILTSPLVRTKQTADIIAGGLSVAPPVATCEPLAPGGTAAQVVEDLGRYARRAAIGIVGHEPGIGELAARLLGLKAPIEFKKGAICRIDIEALPPARPGHLRWFATAKMLRLMAKGAK